MLKFWSVRLSLLALAVVVLGPLLAHLHVLPPLRGLMLFGIGALIGLLGIVAGIIRVLRGGAKPGTVAIGLGLLAMLLVLFPAFSAGRIPPINDVSTDLEDPPALTRAEPAGRSLEYPPAFVPVVRSAYKELQPVQLPEAPAAAFARVEALARAQPGWTVTACDAQARVCEGDAESRLFRFRDDFALRVREGTKGGARVDMRSRSRDGRGDLGANAARIHGFFAQLTGKQPTPTAAR
jgi:uncharacterized protein (DUF1499 family)